MKNRFKKRGSSPFKAAFQIDHSLEPRVMLAGDVGVVVGSAETTDSSQDAAGSQVVFVDPSVPNMDVVLAGIPDAAEVVVLTEDTNGIDQISETLQSLSSIQSIHIISHGDRGELKIGNQAIGADQLNEKADSIGAWSRATVVGADIILYGCDVAEGKIGDHFVSLLSKISGMDVAASTDKTGNGPTADWELEKTIGDVSSGVLLTASARQRISQDLSITIRAAGATGQESMQLQVDGLTVAQWDNIGGDVDSRSFIEFDYHTDQPMSADQMRVVFINDEYVAGQLDRNLYVDSVVINGTEFQTEAPSVFSTGTWRPNIGIVPGNVRSEVLHSNGYFQFADDSVADHSITIHAAGDTGTESMQLLIDGEMVQQWDNIGGDIESQSFQSFHYFSDSRVSANRIRVQFTNDVYEPGFDRNLVVDKIVVDGTEYESEAVNVISTGTWMQTDGIATGYRQSEWLHANGFFQFESDIRTYDGTGNNLENNWGVVNAPLIRIAEAQYSDGISAIGGEGRPSAREISNLIATQESSSTGNARALSVAVHVWGQFIDHDLDLTEPPGEGGEVAPINVPIGDPLFDPFATGQAVIPFTRSEAVHGTGTDASKVRQQANAITAFMDGSMVYGTSHDTAHSLREFSGGRLKTSDGNLLPKDEEGFYFAGDVRAMENVNLTAMHTLFVREHNYWAEQVSQAFPELDDDAVYQEARKIVVAEIQSITYNEFLPALLGDGAISDYSGYDPGVNPDIATEFSTAAFRFGHTMLNDELKFLDDYGNRIADDMSLADAFFDPEAIDELGIGSSVKFMASMQAQEIDNQIVDGLRNFLFGPPGAGGLDLASLNIQRGRDHGLADYNTTREAYGLDRVYDFAEISSNVEIQAKLQQLYGNVDNIDLWVAGLAEDHAYGSSVGETFTAIIADQFERTRDGDRLWYENSLDPNAVHVIHQTTLADIMRRNTSIQNIQDDVFLMWGAIEGNIFAGSTDCGLGFALEGVHLDLYDADGNWVAQTYSDANGDYRFNQITEVGAYRVVLQLSKDYAIPASVYNDVWFDRGNMTLQNVNFHIADAQQFLS